MKTKKHLFTLLAAMMLLPTACSSESIKQEIDNGIDYLQSMKDIEEPGEEGKVITKTYQLKDFDRIDASFAFDIDYTQGEDYLVKMTGTETLLDRIEVTVEGGTLIMKNKKHNRRTNGKIHVVLTAPRLNSIDNSGALTFRTQNLNADNFSISNSGALKWISGNVDCTTLNIHNSGASNIKGNFRAAGNADVSNSGQMTLVGNVTSKKLLTYENSGADKHEGNLQSGEMTMKNSGASEWNTKVTTDNLTIKSSGATTATMTFKGGALTMTNSGSGKMNIHCDCKRLFVKNSGVSNIKFTGTADDAELKSSGIAKINSEELNRY